MSKVFPPRPDEGKGTESVTFRVPTGLLKRLDAAADESNYTRTEAILWCLRWALAEHEAERAAEKGRK